MINRNNKEMEIVVKNGIRISRNIGDISALLNLKKAGVPDEIINRVLFEPQKVRITDLIDYTETSEHKIKLNHDMTPMHKAA